MSDPIVSTVPHRVVLTLFRKELVETLRDRRTLALMFLLPLVVYPFLVVLGSETAAMSASRLEAKEVVVELRPGVPVEVQAALTAAAQLRTRSSTAPAFGPEAERETRHQLRRRSVDVVLTASSSRDLRRPELENVELYAYVDRTSDHAELAEQRVLEALSGLEERLRRERLEALSIGEESLRPLRLSVRSTSSRAEMGGKLLARLLPLLVLFFVALSLFYPAVDLSAGEKERGTLATLLVTPVRPIDVVLGKYLAVLAIGSLAALLNVVVIGSTLLRVLGSAPDTLGIALPAPTPTAVLGLLAGGLLLAASVGAAMLLVASLARSFRDANTLMTPVLLVLLVPPTLLLTLPGASSPGGLAAVPVLGAVSLLAEALEANASASAILLAAVSNSVFVAAAIGLTARLFADERALFSEDGARAEWRSLLLAPPPPGPAAALAFLAWLFAGNYFAGSLIRPGQVVLGVVLVQGLVQLLPALLFARWLSKGPSLSRGPAAFLRLGRAAEASISAPAAIAAGLLIGGGAGLGLALPLTWLQRAWLPLPPEAAGLAQALDLGQTHWLVLVGGLACVPAIAEELAFRGVVLGLFGARWHPRVAVVAQALFFGLLHASLSRVVPTAALGLLLGVLAIRTGWLVPGLIAHATHNALIVLVAHFLPETARALEAPTPWALAAWIPLGVAFWVLRPRLDPRRANRLDLSGRD